ncbi:MAG: hypothetical protein H6Q10_457 [Acidobacteria bacterium]|jgi:hypothetical protein|nr:hypothetical protein [Acidobacteriota bacterium]
MKQLHRALAAAVLAAGLAAPASAGEVRLQIRDGRVTLIARNASPREILAEWARVGQTRIVNAERVPGAPLNLTLDGVPEAKALDLILRSVGGYLAAPRPGQLPATSQYDRIVVLAIARPPAGTPAPGAAGQQQPQQPGASTFQRPARMRQPTVLLDDQDEPVMQDAEPKAEPGPTAPQPGMPTSPAGAAGTGPGTAPAATPGLPTWSPTAPRPGMPTTTPQKPPGQPGGEGGQGR